MDQGREKTSQKEISNLRKQVEDAFNEISYTPSVDPTNKTQVEAAVYQFLYGCEKLLKARHTYFLKSASYAESLYHEIEKTEDAAIPNLTPKELFQAMLSDISENNFVFVIDNFLFILLLTLMTRLMKSTTDLESMRATMATYSEVMSKFKTLVEDKATPGKAVESWFNMIWDRQVKRGIVQ